MIPGIMLAKPTNVERSRNTLKIDMFHTRINKKRGRYANKWIWYQLRIN